jgi:hypothetical protein
VLPPRPAIGASALICHGLHRTNLSELLEHLLCRDQLIVEDLTRNIEQAKDRRISHAIEDGRAFFLSFPLKVASLVRRNWLPADLNLTT